MLKFFAIFLMFTNQGTLETVGVRQESFDSIKECAEYVQKNLPSLNTNMAGKVTKVDGTCLPYKFYKEI